MKTNIVPIGNSKGVRIPKVMLKESNIGGQVEIERVDDTIVIRPAGPRPRQGWEKAFALMHERGEDSMLLGDPSEDIEGWEWK